MGMDGAHCTPQAALTTLNTRWDGAPFGQAEGTARIEIPPGSRSVHLVYAGVKTFLYVAMDSRPEVYSTPDDGVLNQDGAPIMPNADADSPVVMLPVPEGATYLHLRDTGGPGGIVRVTFHGAPWAPQTTYGLGA